MGITVKEVSVTEEKSVQEIESQLLEKHEEEMESMDAEKAPEAPEATEATEATEARELNEDDVLSFIKNKYGKDVSSLDELTAERESSELELPEDVSAYYKYKKETGRGIEDFVNLNRDVDSIDSDRLLRDYLSITEDGLDADDISDLMDEYSYDEDFDEESDIKRKKLNKKKEIAKAKKYFNQQKEKYRIPLESSGDAISKTDEGYEEYKQYVEAAKTIQEENQRKSDWFSNQTDKVFSDGFKGFEFKLDENSVVFNPGDAAELKNIQSNPQNFINKFLDDKGMISDAVGYHKSLAVAMNPEKFAKFFYEQGKATATDGVMKNMKNINMSERKSGEVTSKGGTQIRAINADSGKGLKIRSRK